jgi:hypothetical protein
MKKTLPLFIVFIGIAPLLISCRFTPVRSIEESKFITASTVSLVKIKQATRKPDEQSVIRNLP